MAAVSFEVLVLDAEEVIDADGLVETAALTAGLGAVCARDGVAELF